MDRDVSDILVDIKKKYLSLNVHQCSSYHLRHVANFELQKRDETNNPTMSHIRYQNILNWHDPTKKLSLRKVIFVEGEAGVGKTVLCTLIAKDWASGELFQEFIIVLLLPLNCRNVATACSLPMLLSDLYNLDETKCRVLARYLTRPAVKNILVIADGLDQMGEPGLREGSFLYRLLFDSVLGGPDSRVTVTSLVTSRPNHKGAPLLTLQAIDRCVYVKGFSVDTMQRCIKLELDTCNAADKAIASYMYLMQQLDSNPLLQSICSVPLNLAMILKLFPSIPHDFVHDQSFPDTLTSLYTKLCWAHTESSIRCIEQYKSVKSLSSYHDLPKDLQDSWQLLCELAFRNIESGSNSSRVDATRLITSIEIVSFGFLKPVSESSEVANFKFLHPAFEQYLAVLHLVKQSRDIQLGFIKTHSSDRTLVHYFWQFFFGMYAKVEPDDNTVILQATRMLSNLHQAGNNDYLLCHCSFEAKCKLINDEIINTLSSKKDESLPMTLYFSNARSTHDCIAMIYVLKDVDQQCLVRINFQKCNLRYKHINELAGALCSRASNIQVKELDLGDNVLDDSTVADFFYKTSATLQSLEVLSLRSCGVKNKAVNAIMNVLSSFEFTSQSLWQLDLSYNPLSESCLGSIQNLLLRGTLVKLENFSLKGSLPKDIHLKSDFLTSFVDIISRKCQNLRRLDLSDNYLGESDNPIISKMILQLTTNKTRLDLRLNDEYMSIVDETIINAMESSIRNKGTIDHTVAHGIIVGPGRSGKNTLMSRLTGKGPPDPKVISASTGVAEKVVKVEVRNTCTVAATACNLKWQRLEYDEEALELMMSTAKYHSVSSPVPKSRPYKYIIHNPEQSKDEKALPNRNQPPASSEPLPKNQVSRDDTNQACQINDSKMEDDNTNKTIYIHSSDVPSVELFKKALRLRKGDGLRERFESSWSLYLTNTGGQPEFQEYLPFLISGPTIFFVTFPLHRDLNEPYTIEYQYPDGRVKSYPSSTTLLEELLQILATINALRYTVVDENDHHVEVRPKVFFIGTHKDCLQNAISDTIREIHKDCLQDAISDVIRGTHEHCFQDVISNAIRETHKRCLQDAISNAIRETYQRCLQDAISNAIHETHKHCLQDAISNAMHEIHKHCLQDAISNAIYEIDKQIRRCVEQTFLHRMIQFAETSERMMFIVNNFSESDDDFKSIRTKVQKTVIEKYFEEFTVKCPTSWLVLSLILREKYQSSRVLHIDDCLDIARQCGISSRKEMKDALSFIHSRLGLIRYYRDEKLLNTLVVVDPQIIFDKISELITCTFNNDPAEGCEIKDFKDKGIFSEALVKKVSDKCGSNSQQKLSFSWLADLLNYLRIAVLFKDLDGTKKYFFPSALSHAPESSSKLAQIISPVLIAFKGGFCPRGISGALIKCLMTNEMKSTQTWRLLTKRIFRNQVSFHIEGYGDITLKILPTHLEICIEDTTDLKEICEEVYVQIENCIEMVTSQCIKCEYFWRFYCTVAGCKTTPHPAVIEWSRSGTAKQLWCEISEKSGVLPNGYEMWNIQKKKGMLGALDKMIDEDGVPRHLGEIADFMDEWEGPISEKLELKVAEVESIKKEYPSKLHLQTRAALLMWKKRLGKSATYNKLISIFEAVKHKDYADNIRRMFGGDDSSDDERVSPQPSPYPDSLDQSLSQAYYASSSEPLSSSIVMYDAIDSDTTKMLPEGDLHDCDVMQDPNTNVAYVPRLGLQPSNPSMIRQANQQEFSQISQQFTRDWDPRKGTCPKVDFVYVVSNPVLETRWSAYKQNLRNHTVEEYYHGTKLTCDLSSMPCTNADCGVCGISSMGLDRRYIRKNINFQRFGHGFYLAPNSSDCHNYTQGANGYRAMLRCAVCPGRKYTLRTDQVNLKGPPAGYDCVYGQEGSSLNYAEIVVYNPDAVLPRYIIVYQKDGLQPSNPSMIRQANQQEFSQVSQQFTRDWDPRKGTCPRVDFVYVVSNPALEARWSAYKQNLQNQNVEEYYHGTKLICDLSSMPCTNADCGVCGISNMGLDRRCIRKNINFQRFGHGFYLTPNSSKCHDYTQGANGYRAMLLCAVCPGRKYYLQTDNVHLKGPPSGYDCVYGQEGSSLNYAEIVVYNPDAVLPRYIIVYKKDGVHKIAVTVV